MRLAILVGGKAEQHRWLTEPNPAQVFDCRVCQRLGVDKQRACLLDREHVTVDGWGTMSRKEIVHVASIAKPWDSIVRLRDRQGRPVCPVALVEDEEREWIALETDASEYGRPVEWTDRAETMFRLIRGAKAEAQTAFREVMKKNQKQGQHRGA